MKIYNAQELSAVAADIFLRHGKAQKVAVTSDGMAFIIDESDNAVKNHAKHNRSGKELKITVFTRDEIEASSKPKQVEQLLLAIAAAETVAAVEAIKDEESNGKKRKTVLDAADARINKLNASN